jgi:hypothetical protein
MTAAAVLWIGTTGIQSAPETVSLRSSAGHT